jgi:hypothetical protein
MSQSVLIKFVSILFLSCLLLCVVYAAESQVGVSKGDVFTYDLSYSFTSENPNRKTASDIDREMMEWARYTITEVSGTQVSFQKTLHYNNESEINTEDSLDVTRPSIEFIGDEFFVIIAPNLAANSQYSIEDGHWINETTVSKYPEGDRELNYIRFPVPMACLHLYFDKATGVLVNSEYHASPTFLDSEGSEFKETIDNSIKLRESNVWTVPELPSFLVVSVLMLAIFVVSIGFKWKSRKGAKNIVLHNRSLPTKRLGQTSLISIHA